MHLINASRRIGSKARKVYWSLLFVFCLWPTTGSAANSCKETYTLPPNQWHQISLPCKPNNNSVQAVFGGSVKGKIGKDWAIFDYNTTSKSYNKLSLDQKLSQKKAYWIIQSSKSNTTLDIKGQSSASMQSIPLETLSGAKGWNMIGYPFNRDQALNKSRVLTETSQCNYGCGLDEAKNKGIVHNALWHYNPASKKYVIENSNLSAWKGYWAATLEGSHGSNPQLNIPAPLSVSIMLLGDSITQSTKSHYSYRYYLWKKLLDSNVNFDFVGSMTTNNGGNPQWPNYLGQSFDSDHQSHWGLRADQVFNILKDQTHKPDIVLVHLGTNDEIQNQGVASTKTDLRNIVANLRGKNPRVVIFLAKIIPYRTTLNPILNNSLASLVDNLNTKQSPVILVDQHSGFNVRSDTYDNIHPNTSGEQKMATRWYNSIMQKIK